MARDKTRWEIIDDRGVICSGFSEEETRALFDEADFDWEGDLKLIEVHAVQN